jgi:trigger factor
VKVSVEKLPTSEAVVDVEILWGEMEKASDKAYRKLVKQVDIQGFRRGKAPRSLLERRLGKEYIYQEGLDDLITEAYRTAINEHELTPIAQPKLDAPTFEMGQSYHFSLTVPVITPVELGDYHSLHFEREEAVVTSEEVDKEIESLRQRAATWEVVERPADYGDRVTVDLKLTSGEQKISDLKDNPFELTADDRPGLFSGMDAHIVGMQPGEAKSFTTTIPADYANEKLAGKEANYEVTLHKIEVKHLPELDDAFAAQVSDGQYESLEDLSKGLSDSILERKKRAVRDELREKVMSAVIEQSKFTIHPLLIHEEVHAMLHQFEHVLQQQHMSLDQYLLMMRKNREEYEKELEPEAEDRIKRQLVLEEVAKQEDIQIQPEELEMIFNTYAQLGQELPRTEEQIRSLFTSYRREKTLARLVELTAGPDPDEEASGAEEAEGAVEAVEEENAKAAAVAGEVAAQEERDESNEESATATPLSGDSATSTVE